MRCVYAVYKEGHSPLSAVSVTAENKVESVCRIQFIMLGAVAEKHSVIFFICERVNKSELILKGDELLSVVKVVCGRIVNSADIELFAADIESDALSV